MQSLRLLLAAVLAGGCGSVAQATILPFSAPSFGAVPQNYGDNVATLPNSGGYTYTNDGSPTPNITASYSNTSWVMNVGVGVPGVSFPSSAQTVGTTWSYTLTASPGYWVTLDSLQYGHYTSPSTFPVLGYTVDNGYSITSGSITPNTALTNLKTLDFGDISGPYIVLTFTVQQARVGGQDGIGIDNLRFTQMFAVPEPTSAALLAAGGALLAATVRRRWKRPPQVRIMAGAAARLR